MIRELLSQLWWWFNSPKAKTFYLINTSIYINIFKSFLHFFGFFLGGGFPPLTVQPIPLRRQDAGRGCDTRHCHGTDQARHIVRNKACCDEIR